MRSFIASDSIIDLDFLTLPIKRTIVYDVIELELYYDLSNIINFPAFLDRCSVHYFYEWKIL